MFIFLPGDNVSSISFSSSTILYRVHTVHIPGLYREHVGVGQGRHRQEQVVRQLWQGPQVHWCLCVPMEPELQIIMRGRISIILLGYVVCTCVTPSQDIIREMSCIYYRKFTNSDYTVLKHKDHSCGLLTCTPSYLSRNSKVKLLIESSDHYLTGVFVITRPSTILRPTPLFALPPPASSPFASLWPLAWPSSWRSYSALPATPPASSDWAAAAHWPHCPWARSGPAAPARPPTSASRADSSDLYILGPRRLLPFLGRNSPVLI